MCCYRSAFYISLRLKLARFTGSRASPAAAQSAPASQKTAEPSAAESKAAPAQPAAARPKTASAPAESTYSPVSLDCPQLFRFLCIRFCSFVFCCLSVGSQLPADSTEFHLMQQIRGNLNGFDCDVSALPPNRFLFHADSVYIPGSRFRHQIQRRFCWCHTFEFGDSWSAQFQSSHVNSSPSQAESRMSDACAAQVFSLLHKMPQLHNLNCHRCTVSSAGRRYLVFAASLDFIRHCARRRVCVGSPLEHRRLQNLIH